MYRQLFEDVVAEGLGFGREDLMGIWRALP
jgi:hypothetical protein